jgi:hypothetical protein
MTILLVARSVMKLFQIEEPDGSPADPDAPGAAIGIDLTGAHAEVGASVGGNAVILADREGFPLDLPVPGAAASTDDWQRLFEGARLRAERALARPATHAVVAVRAGLIEPAQMRQAAAAAGLALLEIATQKPDYPEFRAALAAAIRAEDMGPRPEAP